jgi:mono/diheme cytochrome c family protein
MIGQVNVRKMAPALFAGGLLAVALAAGCNKAKPVAATFPPAGPGQVSVGPGAPSGATGGQGVFEANCMRCHASGGPAAAGPGRPMGMKGPDLSKVGADPKHTRDWIVAYARDPKSQKPDSKMPPMGNRLADAELGAVADYLLNLK